MALAIGVGLCLGVAVKAVPGGGRGGDQGREFARTLPSMGELAWSL